MCRVLPGCRLAFVDAGLERAAFLHASDIQGAGATSRCRSPTWVQEGGEVIVQVVKDRWAPRGARLTTNISIPSRFGGFMPNMTNVGVSQKIHDETNGHACARYSQSTPRPTASAPVSSRAQPPPRASPRKPLQNDMRFLARLWNSIRKGCRRTRQAADPSRTCRWRCVRDLISPDVEKGADRLALDLGEGAAVRHQVHPRSALVDRVLTRANGRFSTCTGRGRSRRRPERKADLKSGGHLVIDQTEAMTTIDVNTGAFVGHATSKKPFQDQPGGRTGDMLPPAAPAQSGGIIIIDFY